MENRITAAVVRLQNNLKDHPEETIAKLSEAATLDPSEWAALGDKASLALAEGRVSAEEAMTLYTIHTRFNGDATLPERMVFMQTMAELAR